MNNKNIKEIERLKEIDREVQILSKTISLLVWDQETYMPVSAIDERAKQISMLTELAHNKGTCPEVGELLNKLGADDEYPAGGAPGSGLEIPSDEKPYIRELYHTYTREARLPADLVRRYAEATSRGQAVWVAAREKNDFLHFRDTLAEVVDLTLEKAHKFGYQDHPYDALLEGYEPGMKTAEIKTVFNGLRESLVPLTEKITQAPQIDDSFLRQYYPLEKQKEFSRYLLETIGWDFKRGRLDESAHPFTIDSGSNDIRITSRYNANFLNTGIFGTTHEAGHGFYELGIAPRLHGLCLANGTSCGIHESQSRTWENIIGRSREFWHFFYPKLQESFPEALKNIDQEKFYQGINKVEPSFIRVEADEVTYSLHILLRFELETALLEGKITVDDLPELWRETSRSLLGIVPEQDTDGVLQDIHWSLGLIGYFPTYALGNLYGAQFWEALTQEIGDAYEQIGKGHFESILNRQQLHIHRHGKAKMAKELVMDISGRPLDPAYFIDYLNQKYKEIYSF